MTLAAREVPIAPGLVERVAAGLRYVTSGDASAWNIWFGPGAPPTPQQPEVGGRQFDFATSANMNWQPRATDVVGFQTLRDLADGYDLLRLVLTTRKDQLAKLEWSIKPKDPKAKADARCRKIEDFLQRPDRVNNWDQWNRMFWEEVFVPDALTILPRKTIGGQPYALNIIDGTTIKPIVGLDGRRPLEGVAYQQIIKGIPVADFTPEMLYYRPHEVRANKIYGYSKVEQVITTVNIALRRQLYQLQYYTEGSAPDLLFSVPEAWSTKQTKEFAEWWWSEMAGNGKARRKGMFVPTGVKPIDVKENALKDQYDEWLARIICYCFSVPPQALVKEQNRATANTQKDMSKEEGIMPLMKFQKGVMDGILEDFFDAPDLQFSWNQEAATNPLEQSQIDASDVREGIRTINEIRESRGLDPLPDPPPEAPPPLPPPSGNVSTPEGQPPAASTDKQSTKAGEPAQKLEGPALLEALRKGTRAKKTIKPLKRDRKAIVKLEAKIKKTVAKFLVAQVEPIAEKLHAILPESAEKLEKMSREEAMALLEALDLDWHDLGDDLEAVLSAIAQDGAAQALAQIGLAASSSIVDQVNEKAVAWAEQHAADLVTNLASVTRDRLRADLAASIELGMSVKEIADVIGKDYIFSEARAELIAQTERAFADVAGNMTAYRESGVVAGKEWVLGSEHDDALDCNCSDNADAGVIGLDDTFPGGDDAPPDHPGCVCDVLPVVSEDIETPDTTD